MEMDLTFKTGPGRFNYRVGAIIIHNGCYLLMRNPEASYLYTVGGRVHYGETTEEAVVREIMEETGVRLEPERPVFFMEQIFDEEVSKEHVHPGGTDHDGREYPEGKKSTCFLLLSSGIEECPCGVGA